MVVTSGFDGQSLAATPFEPEPESRPGRRRAHALSRLRPKSWSSRFTKAPWHSERGGICICGQLCGGGGGRARVGRRREPPTLRRKIAGAIRTAMPVTNRTRSFFAVAASVGAFGLFAAVSAARLRSPGPMLTPANLLTLSRAGAASWLCGYAASPRPGGHRAAAWLTLLWAATATDWLDGPLARRSRSTRLGALLDLEADSWLTLWAAVAAFSSGGLPATCMVAPVARYAVRWRRGLSRPMAAAGWQKAAGSAQMAVIAGGLAPNRFIRVIARRLFPWAAGAQVVALAADARAAVPGPRTKPAT